MRHMAIFNKIIQKAEIINQAYIIAAGIIFSVASTIVIVSVMSIIFHGRITYDYLISGIITSFLVSLMVIYMLLQLFSKLKEKKEKIATAENYYHTLFDSIRDCVCIISSDGNFLDVNRTMCNINGYASPADCIGSSFLKNLVDSPEKLINALNRAISGEIVHIEYSSQAKDGAIIWWDSVFSPIKESDGSIKRVLRISRDITEKKQTDETLNATLINLKRTRNASLNIMEDLRHEIFEHKKTEELLKEKTLELEKLNQTLKDKIKEEIDKSREKDRLLQHQSRLAAMGEMISAIAHQWRQPLNAVGLIIQDMRDAYEFGELDKEYLQKNVKKGMEIIKSMSRTIDDFRNFFRPDKEKTTFDVKESIANVMRMLSAELKEHDISFKVTCHAHNKVFEEAEDIISCGEHNIAGYKNEFEHVIMNLINNAKDAFDDERIGTVEKQLINIDIDRQGDKVIMTVKDNAGGIPEEIIGRIFDPYFTTKQQGKGTGIGLYMSKTIIEQNMGGSLSVRNVDGGAEFRIEI